jgi:glutamate:Na+ symporter, ESS family
MLDLIKNIFIAYLVIFILLQLSHRLQQQLTWLKYLYLPDCVVAGTIALLLGPQVLGMIAPSESVFANGLFPEEVRTYWAETPSISINLVFATLFLGKRLPKLGEIWQKAAPQMAFGQCLAWGQYVVGLGLVFFILGPVFGVSPLAATLIEVAFEGGHGTAAGMAPLLADLGFPEGGHLSMGLATVGNVSGILMGTILIAWGRRVGWAPAVTTVVNREQDHRNSTRQSLRIQEIVGNLLPRSFLNLSFVGLSVTIGWLLLKSLMALEAITWGQNGLSLFTHVPLFPMALLGGMVVQFLLEVLQLDEWVHLPTIQLIEKIGIDFTVGTALASISLQVLGLNWVTFVILSLAGILWNVLAFLILAPRIFPSYWFERGIGDMGQSMGITATGLLLMEMADPDNHSGALESFAYKQLMFEPIMGGGLFTAAAPLLIVRFGLSNMLLVTTCVLAFWLLFGLVILKRFPVNSQEQVSPRLN